MAHLRSELAVPATMEEIKGGYQNPANPDVPLPSVVVMRRRGSGTEEYKDHRFYKVSRGFPRTWMTRI